MGKLNFQSLQELRQIAYQLDPAQKVSLFYEEPGTKEILPLDNWKGIYNLGEREVVSVPSKDYTLIEHRPIVNRFCDVLSKFNLQAFGTLRNYNNEIYIDFVFGDKIISIKDDSNINLGIRVKNSYNKFTSLGMEMFGFRAICSNGMILGKVTHVEMNRMHIGEIDIESMVPQFLKECFNSSQKLENYVSIAMSDSIEFIAIEVLLESLGKRHSERVAYILLDLKAKYGDKLTRWQVYNALTWYATHGELASEYIIEKVQNLAQDVLIKRTEELVTVEHN